MQSPKFLPSQYEHGVSLREDIYNTQFTIILSQIVTHNYTKIVKIKKQFKSISDALSFIEHHVNKKYQKCIYNAKFKATNISIIDRYNENVVCGEILNHNINWFYPIKTLFEEEELRSTQESLKSQMAYAFFYYDSMTCGINIEMSIRRLNNFLCSNKYKECSELKGLAYTYYFPHKVV